MSGSVLDGEDLVQETLAQAFYYLPSLRDPARLEPWLFRIAHNKCVDFLRRERRMSEDTVPYDDAEVPGHPPDVADEPIDEALAALVAELPPMERACVVLKDVLAYRLAEVADIVASTVGGVKAALHRGRGKLRALHRPPPAPAALDQEQRRLLEAYADCFNRRDWDALRRLTRADARLEVVGFAEGGLADAGGTYFHNYAALPWEWKLGVARVDGRPLLVHWRKTDDRWVPFTAVRLWWEDGRVVRIRDYVHVEYLLHDARTEVEP
jgi:RNA polymerase sigma-70 factor (ECF subfamily)